ncbi:carbohydrate-binding domain-containing protein [Paenibacillus eucommiae]|uniref:Carbohydrate-binding domain-containing protein n=1 Tax=Paenibacillus eucommiae TaxID=1355755 RepID=A0ABS4IYI9_9BACL|nr:carbohydrate-binding domain-containing protein [Paenibacillus eucommiae]MBP1991604.1 hypothetical protein [Paenibacillus eucommiae]
MKDLWNFKQLGIVLLSAALLTACSDKAATTSNVGASPAATVQSNVSTSGGTGTTGQLASVDLTEKVEYDDDDYYTDWNSDNLTEIKLNGTGASINGSGAAVKDNNVTIASAGTYVVSGKLDDGQIVIDVQDKGTVRLVLNGAEIHNSSSAAINVIEAGKTIISLQEGTDNLVSDAQTYLYPDASTDEPNAAIFSKDDLTINGTGKLVVQGNYNNGITSKDKLKITGGTLDIHAVDDGLMGRDLVAVQEGNMTITAGGDGVKSSNDTDTAKGWVVIAGGTFNIESGSDGIQAASSVLMDGGSYTIVSGGGSDSGSQSDETESESESQSTKAVKAAADIWIKNGTFNLNSADDSLHSNGHINIAGGDFTIASGDDGIHADASISIAGGTIDIAKSYEGIESSAITISAGEIHVVASDDGINAASGNDESLGNGRSGQDQFSASASNKLTISGGYVTVDAAGDGLDANGSIVMTGGTVVVNGPTANGNGALDYDGTFEMSGGFLVAAGSSGMAQATSEQSAQSGILMTYSQNQAAGTMVHLEDNAGNTIITFAPSKNYQAVFVSSPDLQKDAAYTLYSGGTSTGSEANGLYTDGEYKGGTKVVEFELATTVTWLNESGVTEGRSAGPGGGGGGPGGRGGNPGGNGGGGFGGQGGDRMPPDGERPQ